MRRNYFFWASLFLLFLSLVAFSDNLFYDVGQKSNSDPKFIIHGLFFLAWFIILVIQTGYIRKGNYNAHRTLGITGMLIGLGVIVSTFYVFVAVYKGWSVMPSYVKANRFFTISFAVLILLAYINRKYGVKHKRYVYVGTLYVLGPVLDRVAAKMMIDTDAGFVLFETIIWNTLFISLFVYDWRTLRKIHPISWIGYIWFYMVWTLASVL
ncbi:hypothetical protein WG954_15310 [Lacibacter sp. H375]|uniref:hypothetical protein n=1 Tax=Lacibacter sp. H375 TaxID=3133424 RepID=UPI0030BB260A